MERLEAAYGRVLEAFALAACALVLGMTLMICADVLLRNVRILPGVAGLEWSNEISEAMLYLITMLTAPWLLRRGQHIRVDIILRAVPNKVGWSFEWAVDILGLASCLLITYYGARAALASFKAGSVSIKTLVTPEWWLLSVLPVAFLALSIEMLFRMRRLALAEPVAFSFLVINLLGAWLFLGGEAGLTQLARNSVGSVASFSLTPIPLFILMGEVLFHTGLAVKVIDGVEHLIRQVPGRLAVVAVVAGTVFSAISGSTIATTAMLGSLMLPVMLSRGYHPTMATGPLMAIGAVDMLIPPSALTVLLGSLSGISISKLLIGGIVPGLILSLAFVVYIVVRVKMNPSLAPAASFTEYRGWEKFRPFFQYVVPLVSIFVIVVASMSAGWATPTESAAIGALFTILLASAYRALSLQNLVLALRGTASISGMILFIILGATTFSQILSFSGASNGVVESISRLGLAPMGLIAAMMLMLIFLGLFVEQVSMMLITLPIFMPLVQKLGIDTVWFGVMFLICMQLGLLLPPHGLLLMTMKGVSPPQVTMGHIFRAVVPYICMSLIVLALVFFVPAVAVWLPRALF